jgi:hypothetical protein
MQRDERQQSFSVFLVGMNRRLGTGCAKWYTGMNAVNGMLDNA